MLTFFMKEVSTSLMPLIKKQLWPQNIDAKSKLVLFDRFKVPARERPGMGGCICIMHAEHFRAAYDCPLMQMKLLMMSKRDGLDV